jgi:hypothetical protein
MGRGQRSKAWQKWAVLTGLLALTGMGCSASTLGFLFRDDKRPPEIPLPAKEGKKQVTVAILANASPTLSADPAFAGVERELAALLGQRLAEETKDDRRPIQVIEPSKVEHFKATSAQDWRVMDPAAVGKKLGADYVLDLTLESMSIYQPEYGREFYQGRATGQVTVYDTDKPGQKFQDYPLLSMGEQRSTAAVTPAGYRKFFIEKVAREIAHRHIPHETVRELPPIQ